MKSILSTGPFNTAYICNIDLSKREQVKGVTNLSYVPILQVHSSVPYAGDGQVGTSALDAPLQQPHQPQEQQQSWVTPNLDLNLV